MDYAQKQTQDSQQELEQAKVLLLDFSQQLDSGNAISDKQSCFRTLQYNS
jgi:hypothetical protein